MSNSIATKRSFMAAAQTLVKASQITSDHIEDVKAAFAGLPSDLEGEPLSVEIVSGTHERS